MDEEKIDIGLIQRFRSGISVDKKSKKKVLAIFKYLTGKESPIEAVELTVRRDQHLREAQLKVMYEMVKLVEDPPTLVRNECFFLSKFYYFPFFLKILFVLMYQNQSRSIRMSAKLEQDRTLSFSSFSLLISDWNAKHILMLAISNSFDESCLTEEG